MPPADAAVTDPDGDDEMDDDEPEPVLGSGSKTDPEAKPEAGDAEAPGPGKPEAGQNADLRAARAEYESRLWGLVVSKREALTGALSDEQRALAAGDEAIMASYVLLSGALARNNDRDLYDAAIFGLQAFKSGYRSAATEISQELTYQTSTSAALTEVMKGLVQFARLFVWLILGLAILGAIVFAVGGVYAGRVEAITGAFEFNGGLTLLTETVQAWAPILIAVLFGCLGSVVSILLRLSDFDALTGRSREFILYTGASLPFVGGIFAAVTAALFDSHIINLSAGVTAAGTGFNLKLYIIIGFLAGFSERFTRNLLKVFENRVTGEAAEPAKPVAPRPATTEAPADK
ncbi:MAG: hypothetical protein P4L82_05995 [Ancalomicrobiaceae bacterium]|nr:hypothetical protein [Ancalomicrobiaceae bacterium]